MKTQLKNNQIGGYSYRLTSTLSFILGLLLILLAEVSSSQQLYWGPDTNFVSEPMEYGEAMDYAYENLFGYMSTNILVDRSPDGYSKRNTLNGEPTSSKCYWGDFYALYTRMESSKRPYEHPNFIKIDSLANIIFNEEGVIPLGILDYSYEEINEQAKRNDVLQWVNNKVVVNKSYFHNLLLKKRAIAIAPLKVYSDKRDIRLKVDSNFLFTNVETPITHIEIQAGLDDNIYYLNFGDYMEFSEYENDSIDFRIKLVYENGDILYAYTMLLLVDEVNEEEGVSEKAKKSGGRSCHIDYDIFTHQEGVYYADVKKRITASPEIGNTQIVGDMGVFYACGNECGPIKKPFIVATGFAPFGGTKINDATAKKNVYSAINGILGMDGAHALGSNYTPGMNNGSNLLNKLRNEGFDVIILDPDNGVDFVQNTAAFIIEGIHEVNRMKFSHGSYHENVTMGISLSGVAMRLALAKMEQDHYVDPKNNPHHHCRSFISYEGEMQGATIPLGIQAFVRHLVSSQPHSMSFLLLNDVGKAVQQQIPWWLWIIAPQLGVVTPTVVNVLGAAGIMLAIDMVYDQLLGNSAARSLLKYHIESNDSAGDIQLKRHAYFDRLYGQLDYIGYPNDCRKIAISNANNKGVKPNAKPGANLINMFDSDGKGNSVLVNARLQNGIGQSTVFSYTYVNAGTTWTSNIRKDFDKDYAFSSGSYEGFYAHYVLPLAVLKSNSVNDFSAGYRAPFVPIESTFDIKSPLGKELTYNALDSLLYVEPSIQDPAREKGYPHNSPYFQNAKIVTPFDAVFASEQTEFHVGNVSVDIVDFILDEVATWRQEIQNRTISARDNYWWAMESRELLTIGKNINEKSPIGEVVIDTLQKLQVNSEEGIAIRSGFHAKHGSIFFATIRQMNDNCYHFKSLPQRKIYSRTAKGESVGDNFTVESHDEGHLGNFIYPNPVKDVINIDLPAGYEVVEIKDASGAVVKRLKVHEGKNKINAREFSPGIYLMTLLGRNEMLNNKLIVQ